MQEQWLIILYLWVENEFLVIKICMVEIKVMGSEWMCLLELSQETVSILKKLELVFSLV